MSRPHHPCPRCTEYTDEKFYCKACVTILKKPPAPRKASWRPDWSTWREGGKSV